MYSDTMAPDERDLVWLSGKYFFFLFIHENI